MAQNKDIDIDGDAISGAGYHRIASELSFWASQFDGISKEMQKAELQPLTRVNTKTLTLALKYVRNAVSAAWSAMQVAVTGQPPVGDLLSKLERAEEQVFEAGESRKRKKSG